MDLLTREDIPSHFWITHEKLQLSCLHEKLICISSFVCSTIFHGDISYYQLMIKKWVIMNFSIDLPWSAPVVRYQSSTKFVLSSFQLWVLRRLRYAFFSSFLTKKICTEFIAVLTTQIVWVICSLVFIQLYRSPTQQTH